MTSPAAALAIPQTIPYRVLAKGVPQVREPWPSVPGRLEWDGDSLIPGKTQGVLVLETDGPRPPPRPRQLHGPLLTTRDV